MIISYIHIHVRLCEFDFFKIQINLIALHHTNSDPLGNGNIVRSPWIPQDEPAVFNVHPSHIVDGNSIRENAWRPISSRRDMNLIHPCRYVFQCDSTVFSLVHGRKGLRMQKGMVGELLKSNWLIAAWVRPINFQMDIQNAAELCRLLFN